MKEKPFPAAVRREPDPKWKSWFQQVELIKRSAAEEKRKKKRFSLADDGERVVKKIIRPASDLLPIGKLIRLREKRSGQAFGLSRDEAAEEWRLAVEKEIFENSEVHSFKNGVLTVKVHSSALLQEIRQFRGREIMSQLRLSWHSLSPLIKVAYIAGGKKE